MMQARKSHRLAVTAILSAVATLLMFLEFPLPFLVPPFVKLDFSELPALLAAFSLGPMSGAVVCLLKNLIKGLLFSYTMGVGELANFLVGICFVVPAGLIYNRRKSRRSALVGTAVGALTMAVASVPINYLITYPAYSLLMPMDSILEAYRALRPGVNGLLECLILFNAPFTLLKGALDAVLCFLIYKPLSPLLHK